MTKPILKKPVITEKAMQQVSAGKYTFEVDKRAAKKEIAQAVERIFSVSVISVRTNVRPGKPKRVLRTRKKTKTPSRKFAIVTLKKGQKIEGFDKVLEIEDQD